MPWTLQVKWIKWTKKSSKTKTSNKREKKSVEAAHSTLKWDITNDLNERKTSYGNNLHVHKKKRAKDIEERDTARTHTGALLQIKVKRDRVREKEIEKDVHIFSFMNSIWFE